MSDVEQEYTHEQQQAIAARGVSVALTAGAGCGKTFVLTERFMSHLEPGAAQPAGLHELVAFTFTERAAREMRDRIRAKCNSRLQQAKGDDAQYWLELWRTLDAARVTTIHSFCTSFLKAHAVEAKLDPSFRVLDQSQADTLLAELIDDHFRETLARRDEETIQLIVDYGLPATKGFVHTLVTRYRKHDWSRWLSANPDEVTAVWKAHHQDTFLPAVLAELVESSAARTILHLMKQTSFENAKMQDRQVTLVELIPKLTDSPRPLDDLTQLREAAKVQGAPAKRWPDEETYNVFKRVATNLRDKIDDIQKYLAFDESSALSVAQAGCNLLQLASDVVERYDRVKHESAALDFEDLLIRTTRLLNDPDHTSLRRATSSQICALLVDEFQDTDQTQVELVRALCGDHLLDGKLFFVGDKKQSIYRFRGAQPRVFEQLQQDMPSDGRLSLSKNFRSQPAILHFVNALFCERLSDSYQALHADREQVNSDPNIEFMWVASEEAPGASGAKHRAREQEADWMARRIRELVSGDQQVVADEMQNNRGATANGSRPSLRAANPGDIAILFRALSDVDIYEEALRNHGIDYYLVGGHAYYAQQEIFDLLNLLRAVASPADEVSLAGALRSPMFGLTDEALFWLASSANGLNAGLMSAVPTALNEQQQECVASTANTIARLRDLKDRLPVADLINEALRLTGYDAVLLAEFLGERKLANLQKLVNQARENDRDGFSLADFIVQLSQFVAEQPREALAATEPETADVVRLMTIHQAKGLEFPVVIVPDLSRDGDHRSASVAVCDTLGPLVRQPKDQDAVGSAGLDMYRFSEHEQNREESDRLFYVACTRAADYLLLSSSIFPDKWPQGAWPQLISERFDLATGDLRCKLPPDYQKPRVRVTAERPTGAGKTKEKTVRLDLEKWQTEIDQIVACGAAPSIDLVKPIAVDPAAQRRFSFSRLSGALTTADESPGDTPEERISDSAEQRETVDALQLGSVVHGVLEDIDFRDPDDVDALVHRHASRHAPSDDGVVTEATRLVERFLATEMAADLAAARQVQHEVEFMLAWPPEDSREGTRYLHGYIDCLYQASDGSWNIVDYKTNQVSDGQLDAVAGRYEMQMLIYALAAERVLADLPKQLSLFFLRPATPYHFCWNDDSRSRAGDLVNRAIEVVVQA